MNIIIITVILIFLVLIFFGPKKKTNAKSKTKRKNKMSVNAPDKLNIERKYISKNLPLLLHRYNIFVPEYLSRIAAQYLKDGTLSSFSETDLLEGVDKNYAAWVLNHCHKIITARQSSLQTLASFKTAEVKKVELKVQRGCPACNKVPSEKLYKITDDIPLYPCEDCKEGYDCQVWYRAIW